MSTGIAHTLSTAAITAGNLVQLSCGWILVIVLVLTSELIHPPRTDVTC